MSEVTLSCDTLRRGGVHAQGLAACFSAVSNLLWYSNDLTKQFACINGFVCCHMPFFHVAEFNQVEDNLVNYPSNDSFLL